MKEIFFCLRHLFILKLDEIENRIIQIFISFITTKIAEQDNSQNYVCYDIRMDYVLV